MTVDNINAMLANSSLVYSHEDIMTAFDRMAEEITQEYHDKNPIILGVINGAMVPLSFLLVRLAFPLQIDTARATRYMGEMQVSQDLTWLSHPVIPLEGRHVLIFDDILDLGGTLSGIVTYCEQKKAASVKTAVMIDRQCVRGEGGFEKADFTAFHLEDNAFLIGFGLDYQNYFRNLPEIRAVNQG